MGHNFSRENGLNFREDICLYRAELPFPFKTSAWINVRLFYEFSIDDRYRWIHICWKLIGRRRAIACEQFTWFVISRLMQAIPNHRASLEDHQCDC